MILICIVLLPLCMQFGLHLSGQLPNDLHLSDGCSQSVARQSIHFEFTLILNRTVNRAPVITIIEREREREGETEEWPDFIGPLFVRQQFPRFLLHDCFFNSTCFDSFYSPIHFWPICSLQLCFFSPVSLRFRSFNSKMLHRKCMTHVQRIVNIKINLFVPSISNFFDCFLLSPFKDKNAFKTSWLAIHSSCPLN